MYKLYAKKEIILKEQLAIIVNKSCDICLHATALDSTERLWCSVHGLKVSDDDLCKKFELCKEVFTDTFFKIEEIKDYDL